MTDNADNIEAPRKPKELPLPKRQSYKKVIEEIEKWANSSGLRKPT